MQANLTSRRTSPAKIKLNRKSVREGCSTIRIAGPAVHLLTICSPPRLKRIAQRRQVRGLEQLKMVHLRII